MTHAIEQTELITNSIEQRRKVMTLKEVNVEMDLGLHLIE